MDVLVHRQPREQRVVLKYDTAIGTRAGDFLPAQQNLAAVGIKQPGDQRDQGRLTRSGAPDDRDKFAPPDGEVQVVQDFRPPSMRTEAFGHLAHLQQLGFA